eukprot:NODE_140_length_17926_cov_0.139620.p1 type:complete len:622 gc:universal NODE_140_length_17926_cov_0.139620:10425-8560(-)
MTLRSYQMQCIESIKKAISKGIYRQIVSMPVGSGKTFTFAHLSAQLVNGDRKTLILAHRMELLMQAAITCKAIMPKANVQIDQGIKRAHVRNADIIVASVQSLVSKKSNRLSNYNPDDFKLIVVDECHHAVTNSYKKIFTHFGYFDDEKPVDIPLIGFTATPSRDDHKQLGEIFEHLTYHKDIVDLIKDGHLCPVVVVGIKSKLVIEARQNSSKSDFSKLQLQYSINTKDRNDFIVKSYFEHAANDRKSTLVFAVDIDHVNTLVRAFQDSGINAKGISSKTEIETRKEILQAFRNQEFPILINCAILTEGTDIPNIDCLIMARPTLSSVLHQQMLGRGLRNSPNKVNCKIIDIVDGCKDPALTPKRVNLEYAAFDYPKTEVSRVYEKTDELLAKERTVVNPPKDLIKDYQWVEYDLLDSLNERPIFNINEPVKLSTISRNKPLVKQKVMRKLEFKSIKDPKDLCYAFRTVKHPRLKWNNMYGSVFCAITPSFLSIISEEDENCWHLEMGIIKNQTLKYSKSFNSIESAVKYAESIVYRNLQATSIQYARKSNFSFCNKAPSRSQSEKLKSLISANTDKDIEHILAAEKYIDRSTSYDTLLMICRLQFWPFYKKRNYPFIKK